MKDHLLQTIDADALVQDILDSNPEMVERYFNDELRGFNALFRKAMTAAKAKVNPKILGTVLYRQLEDKRD